MDVNLERIINEICEVTSFGVDQITNAIDAFIRIIDDAYECLADLIDDIREAVNQMPVKPKWKPVKKIGCLSESKGKHLFHKHDYG